MLQKLEEEQETSSTSLTRINELMLALCKTIPSLRNWVDRKENFYPPVEDHSAVDQPAPPPSSRAETRMPTKYPPLGTNPTTSKRQFKIPGQLEVLENPEAPDNLSIADVNNIIQVALGQLTRQQKMRHFQARSTFTTALVFLIFGVTIILVGVVFALFNNLPIATITSTSSVVIDLLGLLSFRFHKEENDRYDRISQELRNLIMVSTSMHYITTYISDTDKKDQAICNLIRQAHSLPAAILKML